MRKLLLAVAMVLLAHAALSQVSYDTVTATVIDPDGQALAGGRYSMKLVDSVGNPVSSAMTPDGQLFNAKPVYGQLDASGSFSVGLVPNNILSKPSGTRWLISIIPPLPPDQSQVLTYQPVWNISYYATITAPVDLSAQLSTLASNVTYTNLQTGQSTFAGWLTGAGAPALSCSAGQHEGYFYLQSNLELYQCAKVSGVYGWNLIAGGGGGGGCGPLAGDSTSTNCGNNNLQGNAATYEQTFGYTNGNMYPTVSKIMLGSYNMVPSYFFINNPFVGVGYDNFTGGTYTNFGTSLGMYAFGYGNFDNTGSWNLQNADATAVGDDNFNLNSSTITSFRTNYAFGTDNFSGGSTLPSNLSLSENMGLGDSNFCASQYGTTTITDSFLVGEFNDCFHGSGSMTQHNVFGFGDTNLNFAMGTATDVYNDLIGIGDTSTQLGTLNVNDTSHDVIGIGNKTMDGDNVSEIVAAGHLAAEWVQSSNYIVTSGYTTLRHVTNSHDVIAMGNMILNNGGFSNLPDTGLAYVQAEGYNVLPLQTITNLTDAICKGDNACPNVTGGSDIIAIGRGAGALDATGTQGVWIGQGAGPNASGLVNTVAIGQGATNTMSNQTTIGNASVTSLKLYGCPAGQTVYDDGSGTCYTPGSGGGAVSSVFGRTGAVTAQSGDYSVSQVTGAAPLASPTFTGTVNLPSTTIIGGAPTNGQFWGYNGTSQGWYTPSGSGGMVYPPAGVPNSTGTAWGTSYAVGTSANNLVQLNGTAQLPAVSGVNLTAVPSNAALYPTLNQNTTGNAANVTGVVTVAHGGTNAATNTAALSNLLGNPAIGTYAINCTSTSSCTYTSASGSGTVNSGTAGQITYYAGSGTAVSGDANLDDGATTAGTLTYKGTGGITASAGPIKATGTTVGLVLSAGTAATGGAGKVVYATDATNGYAEVNENNTGLSRVCTAANGVCPGTGTVTDGAGTTTAGQVLLSTTTAHAYSINATLPVASGGTGTASPSLVAGTGISITGTWPNQTVGNLVADTTFATATTAVAANSCDAAATTVTMTGLTTSMTVTITPSTDVSGTTGWSPAAAGQLYFTAWPSAANTLSYKRCNPTSASITPGAVTWNVSAR